MVAAPRPYGRAYACLSSHGGCNGTTIKADPVEATLIEAALQRLDESDLSQHESSSDEPDVRAELAALDRRSAELAEMFAAGEVTRTEWVKARDALASRREAAEAALAADSSPLDSYSKAGSLRRAWPKLSIDQQRTIMGAIYKAVVIAPAGRAGGRVDLGRISAEWAV
jgi:hypothetical protein